MANCLLCNCRLTKKLTVSNILFPGPLEEPVICTSCFQRFIRYPVDGCCQGCGREEKTKLCSECQKWREQYGWYLEHRPLFHYNQAMKEFMQEYKFQGQYHLRSIFNEPIKEAVVHIKYDLLIPIPVTEHTMLTRGFNQVTGLLGDIPYTELLVHRNRQKVAQSEKDRQSRLQTEQPFLLKQGVNLRGKTVLLVDDIYTTGRTLYHAAVLCYENGSKRVQSLSLAR